MSVDPYVARVQREFDRRSKAGYAKYGVGLDRDDLSPKQWLTHLQQELMDAILYIERLKDEAQG